MVMKKNNKMLNILDFMHLSKIDNLILLIKFFEKD